MADSQGGAGEGMAAISPSAATHTDWTAQETQHQARVSPTAPVLATAALDSIGSTVSASRPSQPGPAELFSLVITDPRWKRWQSQGRFVCKGTVAPKWGWGERHLGWVRERNKGLDTTRHSRSRAKLKYKTVDLMDVRSGLEGRTCYISSPFVRANK